MASCAVRGCFNNRKFLREGISFHTFPKDDLQKEWLQALGKSNETFVWSKNKIVCSEHFKKEDFVKLSGKRLLKPNAIPSLKLGKVQIDAFDTFSSSNILVPSTSTIESSPSIIQESTLSTD